jgi:hypothetical protein
VKSGTIETTIPATADPKLGEWRVLTATTQLYGQGCRKLCSTPAVTIIPRSLRGMNTALRVGSDMRRSVFTGTLIAGIVPCTTPRISAATAGRK